MSDVIAILCADIHLSHKPPVARSAEKSWYAAMRRPLDELSGLAEKHGVSVICAGDVFDRWASCPELINFALEHLPEMYVVPGQHDLPNHNYEEKERSAYWTLVKAGMIDTLDDEGVCIEGIDLAGFPWGFSILSIDPAENRLLVAVIHRFIYRKGKDGYPGAPVEQEVAGYRKELEGYDVAVFGDNHKGFLSKVGDCTVFNCGTMMRRKIDEVDYKPMVGLLRSDGTVEPYFLDCSEDKFMSADKLRVADAAGLDLSKFMSELESLGGDELDFRSVVDEYLDRKAVDQGVRKAVLQAMEGEL